MAYDPNDENDKKLVADMIAEAVAKNDAAMERMKKDLAKAKEGKAIDPAEVTALEAEIAETRQKLADAAKQNKELAKEIDTTKKSLEAESGYTRKLIVENGLTDALVAEKVAAPFLPAVKAMLGANVQIVTEGDTRKAMVGDKPLGDYIKAWAASDEGKHYVQAPNNRGSGANPVDKSNAGKTMTRSEFDALTTSNPAQASGFFRTGGSLVDG